jgi:ParB family transcriptional regulator, chromosome partitioning protein
MACKNCQMSFKLMPTGRKRLFCSAQCRKAYHIRHKRHLVRELSRTEWYSPTEFIEAARAAMGGIDLDPASCAKANEAVRADRFYSVREDGLAQDWFGKIWLNPPYGRFAPKFVERFIDLFKQGSIEQGILLLGTHHLTTNWFHELIGPNSVICLPNKRLQFSGSLARPAHGSVIIGIGVNQKKFIQAFSELGRILCCASTPVCLQQIA